MRSHFTKKIEFAEKLSKLLSVENINFVESPVAETASFDIQHRTLVIPTFGTELTDATKIFLTAPECGHALHTPLRYVELCKQHNNMLFSMILNIVEDVSKTCKSRRCLCITLGTMLMLSSTCVTVHQTS